MAVLTHAGGRLCTGCNDDTAPPNYGGTELGTVQDVYVRIQPRFAAIEDESYGGQVVDTIELLPLVTLEVLFRSWNADMLEAVYPLWHSSGGVITVSGRGSLGSDIAADLWVLPDISDVHPIHIPHAKLIEAKKVALSKYRAVGLRAVFQALPDSSGQTYFQNVITSLI